MSIQDKIEKTLRLCNVCEEEIVTIKTDTTIKFSIHLLKLLVFLLCNFFFIHKMNEEEQYNLITKNLSTIVDVVTTEVEIALLVFSNLHKEEYTDIIELHNKDECLLVVAIQSKVNKNLEKIKGE